MSLAEHSVFFAEFEEVEEDLVKLYIVACIDKSIALLTKNITEMSLYYLCEWDMRCSTLTIVITDETKSIDSKNIVKCSFNHANKKFHKVGCSSFIEWENAMNSYAGIVRNGIRDYLMTCPEFMNYSLVAIFHSRDRRSAELL